MTPARTPDDPHGAQAPPGPLTVLYIEDNAVNAALMAGLLDMLPGVRMLHAAHPEDGLALARSEQPALVLVDIQMPGMDGYEVLRRLRDDPRTQTLPVIAVTANALPQDLARGQAAGFAAYLTKPLHLPRLLRTVCALLGQPVPADLPADL